VKKDRRSTKAGFSQQCAKLERRGANSQGGGCTARGRTGKRKVLLPLRSALLESATSRADFIAKSVSEAKINDKLFNEAPHDSVDGNPPKYAQIYGTYLTFLLGFVSTIVTVYYLAIN
jgi:hypothetical protein